MSGVEMDGFVTGLQPERVPLSEWMAPEPELYGPALEVDERTQVVIWKPWIGEFSRARGGAPTGGARIEASKESDVLEAMQVVQTLYAAANGTGWLSDEGLELLDIMAPVLIGGMAQNLNELKKRQGRDCVGK